MKRSVKKFAAGVVYTLSISPEDMPVRGNASAWDDEAENESYAAEIIEQLERGNDWAWCIVTVTARHPDIAGLSGVDHLGGCSYRNEAELTQPGGYYDGMRAEALDDLLKQIDAIATVVCS